VDALEAIKKNLMEGAFTETSEIVRTALDQGIAPEIILNQALFPAMDKVGLLFREEEIYVPEVLLAAKVMQTATDVLEPYYAGTKRGEKGKILLGTVEGDVHNLGKNLVNIMLRGAGFEVLDIGENVPAKKFVEKAIEEKALIIGMSALLTTTMGSMKEVVEAVDQAGLNGKVRTLIGGACVSQRFADEIGADGYAENAGGAVLKVKEMLGLN
jgi:5-methyltetrahydrofolate--homocysteine methyltransferase